MTQRTGRDGEPSSAGGLTRRGLLGALAAGTVGGLAAASPAQGRERVVGSWPAFQYDRQNTGYARGEQGPRDSAGARWGFRKGESFESTPVVTGDSVYAADPGAGVVVALDRATGTPRWRVDTDVGAARMTVVGDTLLVPSQSLEARSLSDGSLNWRTQAGTPDSVITKGSYAYVASGGGAYRVSLIDESVDWHSDRVNRLQPGLALTRDLAYAVGKQYAQVIALNQADGSGRWLRRLDGSATGAPTAADDQVYIPTSVGLTAMSAESGIPEWTADTVFESSVAAAGGTVYGTTSDGTVVALDAATGDQEWAKAATTGSISPILAGSLLFVTGTDGSVAALNPGDGTVVWQSTVGGSRLANPAAAGAELYVGDQDGNLAALAAGESGGLRTATPTPSPTEAPTATPTEAPAAEESTPTPTSTEGPGFGLVAGAVATGAGALAELRRRSGDDDE
jgi:outer membrane protein assembly factor BamB